MRCGCEEGIRPNLSLVYGACHLMHRLAEKNREDDTVVQ